MVDATGEGKAASSGRLRPSDQAGIPRGRDHIRCRPARLSCYAFRHNAVRLQLFAPAYNLANFLRSLASPNEVAQRSLTTLRKKLVKIGARIVRHGGTWSSS